VTGYFLTHAFNVQKLTLWVDRRVKTASLEPGILPILFFEGLLYAPLLRLCRRASFACVKHSDQMP
jgi:hypothetical protein